MPGTFKNFQKKTRQIAWLNNQSIFPRRSAYPSAKYWWKDARFCVPKLLWVCLFRDILSTCPPSKSIPYFKEKSIPGLKDTKLTLESYLLESFFLAFLVFSTATSCFASTSATGAVSTFGSSFTIGDELASL